MTDIIFNDVSLLHTSLETEEEARTAFENFIFEIAAAIDDGIVQSVIRSQVSLLDSKINLVGGDEWSISRWLEDKNVDRDARRLILTLENKVPMEMEYLLSKEDEAALVTCIFRVPDENGLECFAFGFALHTESIVASIPTHNLWKSHVLSGSVLIDGSVVRHGLVHHISQSNHSEKICKILNDEEFSSIVGRAEFVAKKDKVFPYLKFSPEIDHQIEKLTARQILNLSLKLLKMNNTAKMWNDENSAMPRYQFSWRGESEQTMKQKEYRQARTFKLPDGEKSIFENHLDFSASHRIHFIEDADNKTFIIGYVGDHLPTVKYKH
jgi:hypothetical protein